MKSRVYQTDKDGQHGEFHVPSDEARMVLDCFRKHPNRSLAPSEIRILIGRVKWDVKKAMKELAEAELISERPEELHVVKEAVPEKIGRGEEPDEPAKEAIVQTRFRLS